MAEQLTLTQQHLYTYKVCPRRFYLRFLACVPWPEAPLGAARELAYERGRRFHRWVERYLLDLPVTEADSTDSVLNGWWATFREQGPELPAGQRFVETALTAPIGQHFLTGRFDLLIVGARAWLFDWKTGDPRPVKRLRAAWQTRVYLAVLAQGGAALSPADADAFAPRRLSFTYWYVAEPAQPRVIPYDAAAHRRNWLELESLVAEIDRQLSRPPAEAWPLTDDWSECRHCAYRALCGRQAAGAGALAADPADAADEDEPPDDDWLEPRWG